MIAVRLMGGLGNQMFQYAAARRLADSRGVGLTLDLSRLLVQPPGEVPRDYGLDCFRIRAELSEQEINTARFSFGSLSGRRRTRLLKEETFRFQDRVLRAPDGTLLLGYWQSERYFEDDEEAIREDFSLRRPLGNRKQAVADQISDNTVSVHVRRTDYVSHPRSAEVTPTLPRDYYRRAVARITRELPSSPHFLVISDDPEWCREHLDLGYPTTVVERGSGPDFEDMRLMSMCRRHIIANSSFSWWGAWLAENRDQTVIAPKHWFADQAFDARDLVPERWILM